MIVAPKGLNGGGHISWRANQEIITPSAKEFRYLSTVIKAVS